MDKQRQEEMLVPDGDAFKGISNGIKFMAALTLVGWAVYQLLH